MLPTSNYRNYYNNPEYRSYSAQDQSPQNYAWSQYSYNFPQNQDERVWMNQPQEENPTMTSCSVQNEQVPFDPYSYQNFPVIYPQNNTHNGENCLTVVTDGNCNSNSSDFNMYNKYSDVSQRQDSYASLDLSKTSKVKDKYRVVYSEFQRTQLEKEFLSSQYITIERKSEIAKELNLTSRQVKIWFQNRRAKQRKLLKKLEERQPKNMNHNIGVMHHHQQQQQLQQKWAMNPSILTGMPAVPTSEVSNLLTDVNNCYSQQIKQELPELL